MRDVGSISVKEKILIAFFVLQGVTTVGLRRFIETIPIKIKPERFPEQLKKDKEIEITVQQFICPYCRSSVYKQKKKRKIILF